MTATLLARRPGAAITLPPEVDLAIAAVRNRAAQLATPAPEVDLALAAVRNHAQQVRPIAAGMVPWLVRGLVATAVVAFGFLAIGPHVFGYRTMTMLTASMAPEIEPGDITVVTPLAVEDVTEGMVIAYNIPIDDHRVVSHRVVEVERGENGSVTVQTKGDNNDSVDPWKATLQGDTAWQVRAVVPEVGHLIRALRTPGLSEVLRYGAVGLAAAWLLLGIWRPTPAGEAGTETTDPTEKEARA
jgi:signal peptidase I